MRKTLAVFATVTAITGAGFGLDAQAAPQLQLSLDDGQGNSALLIDVGQTGLLIFNGALGSFIVNVTTGTGYPVTGTLELPKIDLNSINVSNTSGGTLTMKLTEIGLVDSGLSANFSANIGGTVTTQTPGATLTYQAFVDPTNAAFGMTTQIGNQVFGPGAFAYSNTVSAGTGALYSMTEVVILTVPAGDFNANISFNGELHAVAEPVSLAALGTGLLGLGFVKRRKKVAESEVTAD